MIGSHVWTRDNRINSYFQFDDANNTERYKVPVKLNLGTHKAQDPRYEVKVTHEDPFSFQIIRKSDKEVLWEFEQLFKDII